MTSVREATRTGTGIVHWIGERCQPCDSERLDVPTRPKAGPCLGRVTGSAILHKDGDRVSSNYTVYYHPANPTKILPDLASETCGPAMMWLVRQN